MRSAGMKRWITPSPPARAIVIAMADSVTVSMFALTMGMARAIWRVRRARVFTAVRLAMEERLGTSSTSSKVRPSASRIFMAHLSVVKPVGRNDSIVPYLKVWYHEDTRVTGFVCASVRRPQTLSLAGGFDWESGG